MGVPLHILVGMRWLTYLMAANNLLAAFAGFSGGPHRSPGGGWPPPGWCSSARPAGCCISVAGRPDPAPEGGARDVSRGPARCTCACGWPSRSRTWPAPSAWPALPGCPTTRRPSARRSATTSSCIRCRRSPECCRWARGCNIEPEVDLSGWWIDGDSVHIGAVHIGAGASRRGAQHAHARAPRIGAGAQVEPGSAVLGKVKAGQLVAGSPAERRSARPSTHGRTRRPTIR